MTTPPLSGRYIGYWRLRTADGQNFGHRIWADVLVTGGTADLVIEGSMVSLLACVRAPAIGWLVYCFVC